MEIRPLVYVHEVYCQAPRVFSPPTLPHILDMEVGGLRRGIRERQREG